MQPRLTAQSDGFDVEDGNFNSEINPTSWRVNFDACYSITLSHEDIAYYTWTIGSVAADGTVNEGPPVVLHSCLYHAVIKGNAGSKHRVQLTVTDYLLNTDTTHMPIYLTDHLIVSIGDSFASGEGNPNTDQVLDDNGNQIAPAKWSNEACHRSYRAGPVLAALKIEEDDPHSSVTFVHLACSGAEVYDGILNGYGGWDDHHNVPAQIDSLRRIHRHIDALLISIGGNDIGFQGIIQSCLLNIIDSCMKTSEVQGKIDALGGRLRDLALCLTGETTSICHWPCGGLICLSFGLGIQRHSILITQYPDLTHDTDGGICRYLGITKAEFSWSYKYVLKRLNQKIDQFAVADRWNPVYGIQSASTNHGICAGSQRWFNTISDAENVQGQIVASFHPNNRGHSKDYAPKIVNAIQAAGILN